MAQTAQSSKSYTNASMNRMLREIGYSFTTATGLVNEAHEGIPTVFVDADDTVFDMIPAGPGNILVKLHK